MKPPLQRIEEFLEKVERQSKAMIHWDKSKEGPYEDMLKLGAALKEAVSGLHFELNAERSNNYMQRIANILDGGEK